MATKRRKALPGCYWRGKTLWGRSRVGGQEVRWSLNTDDPKVAAERRKNGQTDILAVRHGDGRRDINAVVEEWHALWLERNKSPKTVQRYLCSIGQLALFLDGKQLGEINGKLVADIIKVRQKEGVTNATIKRDLVALSSVLNYAVDQGWCENNPVLPRLARIEERRDPIVLPSRRNIDLVVARCPGMIAEMVRAAMATGMREDELLRASPEDIDHERQQIRTVGKRNKVRVIDLDPFNGYALLRALPRYPGCKSLFWHSNGQPYRNFASQFTAIVARVAKSARKAEIEFRPFRFHDLRHWHAVQWLKDGRSIYDLQHRLGHGSIKTTEIYLEYLTPEEERIAKGLNGHKNGHKSVPTKPVTLT